MATDPNSVTIAELVRLWADVMPELRDQGEADRMNALLGNLLDRFKRAGKTVPPMPFITDAPPDVDRAALIEGNAKIDPIWFGLAYLRWWRGPLFKRFWESLSDDEKRSLFENLPKS